MPHDFKAIRKLIDAAFGSEDFDIFCHDHYNEVYGKFTTGQSKPARIQFLIEHAKIHGLADQLLLKIRDANPHQYAKFEHQLRTDEAAPIKIQIAKLPVAGEHLFGRETELEELHRAWEDPGVHVLTLVAFGGVGKTTLVNHWLRETGQNRYGGAVRVYGWSFYSQGASEGTQASADEFFAHALKWFGDPDPVAGSPWERGLRLVELVRKRPTLLILDGLEPVQYPPGEMQGKLKDQGLQALMRELRQHNTGLCVVTTRIMVEDIADAVDCTVKKIDLENLSEHAGAMLLEKLGTKGAADELKKAVREFGGHALALNLLGRFLAAVHEGDIRKRDLIPDLTKNKKLGGHARRVMESYVKWFQIPPKPKFFGMIKGKPGIKPELNILYMMGLFDRPAEKGAIEAVLKSPAIKGLTDELHHLDRAGFQEVLHSLRGLHLLAKKDESRPGTLDCHPLVREHFGEKLKAEKPDAWKEAHSRLYEYFKDLPEKELPDTLEEMEPLFAAAAHGCLAGRYQEVFDGVYWKQIVRKNDYYVFKKLGAFGSWLSVLSNFYKKPWAKVAEELNDGDIAVALSQAGFALRSVGRLRESAQPMQAAVENNIRDENWHHAAMNASNLSELHLTLGDVAKAVEYGRQSVEFADRSGDGFMKEVGRTTHADALHQQGDLAEAERLFQEAETMQKERQPEYFRLYSLRGYQYCDLLLSQGRYGEVRERAEKMFSWRSPSDPLLDISLENLSYGRSLLLQTVTEKTDDFTAAEEYLHQAVEGLRAAGNQDDLPRGILARTELYRIRRDFAKAQNDLSEVRELAERSGMKLHLADFHLESARLARERMAAGESGLEAVLESHVREAGRLIQETGYFRRKGELAALTGNTQRNNK